MAYNLMAVTAGQIMDSALYAVLGFGIVFLGIAFLIFVVWLVGKVMSRKNGKPKTEAPVKKEEPVVVAKEPVKEEISEETIAVIMAALMAYYEKNNPKCEFTVRRIKRI